MFFLTADRTPVAGDRVEATRTMKGKRKSVRFGGDMSDPESTSEELKLVSKFAGEAFGTDNVRTVFAGASEDNVERADRVIVLIGPAGTGKSTLIDCMCNYFYGATLKSHTRYKIADEIFDQTTPIKTIIKYVFNQTNMPYRPIVIDTPGIGSESGVQTDAEISEMLTSFLVQSHRVVIHAIGFVLKYSDSRVSLKREAQIKETLSMFPKWMVPNVVPMLSSSDGTGTIPPPIRALLQHLGLSNNRVFFFNSGSLFDVSEAEAITEQLRSTYWTMTMEGLEGFFEHVGQLNPQCIAEELPAPPSSKSPSLRAEKQFSGELQTPSYKPPPPLPPVIDKTESTSSSKNSSFHTSWNTSSDNKQATTSTTQSMMSKTRSLIEEDFTDAPYSKIRKTSYEAKADEHRERIIPIKLLHTPSKMSLGMEHSQSFENRRSFFESTSQQHSTEYDAMKTGAGNGSVMKRYTYDPSSMSHKEFLLKGPSKTETAGGDGIDLIKDTPNTPTTPSPTGGTSLSRPQRVTETVINDVPIENLVNSGGYTHIKSSPPPDYTPEPSTQRTPLATLAGADQRDTRQLTASTADIDAGASTTTFARSSLHRKLEKRSSSRDAIGITPLTEPSPALSAQSDWTYHSADDVNIRSSESNMQSVDQSSGHLSPAKQHQQQNDFIITPEMKRSRSPIVVRVTMGRKDRNITRIGEEQQSDTMTGSKKPIETNIDDVTSPEYNSTWTGLNRMSQSSLNDKQNIASSYNTDVVSGFATHYAYSGSAAAIATGSAPGAGDSPQGGSLQQTQSLRAMNAKNWASNCGGEQTTTTTSTTLAATGGNVVRSALQQNRSTYGINGTIAATNTRNSGYGYSSDETTNTITNTTITQEGAVPTGQQSNQSIYGGQSLTAQRSKSYGYGDEEIATTAKTAVTEGSMGDVTTNRYRKNPNFNTSSQAIVSQRGQGYGYDGEQMTTTTTKTTVTTADGVSQQQRGSYGMQLNSTNKRYSKGIDYDEDEITTTMKNVVTAENNGIDAQPNRGSSVFLARKGAGYGYGDEEYTTTTKTITTSEAVSGAPHVPLHQTQNVYGVKKGAADYGYEDEETTVTKTTTTVRYDIPPGNIDSTVGNRQKDDIENCLQYSRNEKDDLLGHHSSFHTHQLGVPAKNYLARDSQLTSSLLRDSALPSSQPKKRRFSCLDFVFFVLAPCFILFIIIAILITIGLA